MAENFLDSIGIDANEYNEASDSTVTEAFEVLPSGVYPGKVKEIILFISEFKDKQTQQVTESTQLKVVIEVTATVNGNEVTRALSYRNDIGKTKKDGTTNAGFLARLKSLESATGVEVATLTQGDATKVNSYGKECAGQYLNGMNGKPVQALVRFSRDSNKAIGEAYRDSNDIEGVCAPGSEDIEKFNEKVEKALNTAVTAAETQEAKDLAQSEGGVFTYAGYKAKGAPATQNAANPEANEKVKTMKF